MGEDTVTVYRFDPGEMLALAAQLHRAAGASSAASLSLLTVPTYGLPPEAKGLVEDQTRALWRLLAQGDAALTGAARYLTRMATAVKKADDPTLRAAGLDVVKATKTGEVVLKEVADRAARTRKPLGDRARRWARILGTLSGEKAVLVAVGWSEWRKALRDAKVDRHGPLARKVSAALRTRTQSNIEEMRRSKPGNLKVPFDSGDGKWKQWTRRFVGMAPGPLGDAADFAGWLAAGRKLRADEPQTGVSQALTDVRDFVDLVAASNHLAADIFIKSPLTAPAAAINEGIGLGADAVVLTFDTANEARKGLGKAAEDTWNGIKSLGGLL